jgi:hypothetical protein
VLDQLGLLRHHDIDVPVAPRFSDRWAVPARHRRPRRKGAARNGRLIPGRWVMARISRSCPWSVGRPSTRRASGTETITPAASRA